METNDRLLTTHVDPSAWQQALYGFLAEKEKRSGPRRTVESYSRMLACFFGKAGKSPDRVTGPDVLGWAFAVGDSGRSPSASTIGARIACLSSFYRFLIRMGIMVSNPCDALERPKVQTAPARGLTNDDVRRLLAVIPDTVPGRRDGAIILTLVLTACRSAEAINLKAGDISTDGDRAFYAYRGKGGKRGRRELARPAYEAMVATLADASKSLATMHPRSRSGRLVRARVASTVPYSTTAFAAISPRPVSTSRASTSSAKLRRDAGESIESVSQFLDHSSLAVTTVYLRRLEGQDARAWARVADAIGVG